MKNQSGNLPSSTSSVSTIELICHPATLCSVPFKLEAQCTPQRLHDGWALQLTYVVMGSVQRLRLPALSAPTAADGLWAHTCFEAFFSEPASSAYREFNLSPSTQWAHYRFTSERIRDQYASELGAPTVQPLLAEQDRLVMTSFLAASPSPKGQQDTLFAPTAVLELDDGSLSYWAPSHTAQKPDFHARAGWTIPLGWTID